MLDIRIDMRWNFVRWSMIGENLGKEKQLPIIYVQLAGFSDGNIKKQGTQWAEFREVQRQAMEIENTAMIQAYDVGEYNDLHPMDKKTLGMRAALAVHKLVYGEKEECTGPQVRKIRLTEIKEYMLFLISRCKPEVKRRM